MPYTLEFFTHIKFKNDKSELGYNLVKFPAIYFVDIDKPILKCIWRSKVLRIVNAIMENNKFGGLSLPNFEIY